MAAANYPDPILTFTLQEEGGFSNNPDDPGGATEHGITLRTFRNMMHDQALTVADLQAITPGEEATIYRTGYWTVVDGDNLPSGIDVMVFDEGVNAGPARSERMLQEAAGLTGDDIDGVIGPQTLAAVAAVPATDLVTRLTGIQRAYYRSLDTFDEFGEGWMARIDRRMTLALKLIPHT